jgi:hypothetical protein
MAGANPAIGGDVLRARQKMRDLHEILDAHASGREDRLDVAPALIRLAVEILRGDADLAGDVQPASVWWRLDAVPIGSAGRGDGIGIVNLHGVFPPRWIVSAAMACGAGNRSRSRNPLAGSLVDRARRSRGQVRVDFPPANALQVIE